MHKLFAEPATVDSIQKRLIPALGVYSLTEKKTWQVFSKDRKSGRYDSSFQNYA